ncbi:DUF4175 family protein [Hymenobacter metallicola]|uniref:DUF4175 family protein n=1 Tax=Hymenobacter metallicola TaxID=2563114 RepID=A0A4Z0QBJ3_9BACT|nr:DUF4175 family protein [Hymenobacter metallicola]TGE26431.1 hypothetical protein E5K02_16690 [Hymenobacter metallicola]
MSVGSNVLTSASPGLATLLPRVQQQYRWRRSAMVLLPTVLWGAVMLLAARTLPQLHVLVAGLALLGAGLASWRLGTIWRQPLAALARQLDRQFADLEDSTGLLLRPVTELNLLEQLQQQRTATRLANRLAQAQPLLSVRVGPSLGLAAGALATAGALWLWQAPATKSQVETAPNVALHFPSQLAKSTTAGARIVETRIRIIPPTYTRRPAFMAAEPSFRCPQASRVQWTVLVSGAAERPQLEVGRQRLPFQAVPGRAGQFTVAYTFRMSTLYRIRFAGRVSDDYAVEVQPDRAPAIQLRAPKPYTLVEFGQKPEVAVRIALSDDYGLVRARLVATVAQGQGEAVKFKEVATELNGSLRGQPTQANLTHLLRLPSLGLTYGDEVYFYVQAWDNNRHSARSDTYLVQWEDTTVDDSGSDMAMGVNVVPAYFRSQRQVIIDTEKLLAERRQLEASAFTTRSNDLGHDQKVLRLRYGKFLGEEFEESFGQSATVPPGANADNNHSDEAEHAEEAEAGHDHGGTAPADASPSVVAEQLLDTYVHHHDDSETADFLEPAVKAKLRGVLSQMWEAELRLRTARPAEALPYEYRALRLLKQVQQQTRVYVRKSGFEPPVIPEATTRLTGELATAAAPRLQQQVRPAPTQPAVRTALRVLAALHQGTAGKPADAAVLEQASPAVAQAALRNPGRYLSAVRQLRQLTSELRNRRKPCLSCVATIEAALTDLLPQPAPAPTRVAGPTRLARRYFQELSR